MSRASSSAYAARYLRWLGAAVAAGVAVTLLAVLVIDPYRLYRIVDVSGFNAIKPRASRHQNEIKVTHAAQSGADVLIVGNSRAEIGFDPQSPAFEHARLRAYSLAVPGSAVSTARQQLAYLYRIGSRPKRVIVGVEFLDFLGTVRPAASNPGQTPREPRLHPAERWAWRVDSLFSLQSIGDALRTLRIQSDADAEVTTAQGFNPLNEYRPMARRQGYYPLFRQRAQENARSYARLAGAAVSAERLDELRALVDDSAAQEIEVMLVIYPYHAQILAMFGETGLDRSFDDWKRQLTELVAQVRLSHRDARIELIDFSGFGPYNCEAIPERGDGKTETRWYWESGHFKKALGDVVLDRSIARRASEGAEYPFGMQLEPHTLGLNLQRIQRERIACEAAQPALFVEANERVAAARQSTGQSLR